MDVGSASRTRKRARVALTPQTEHASSRALNLAGGEACPSGIVERWRRAQFCDAKVSAAGVVFDAHRVVLSAASGFFDGAFSAGLAESATASVAISDTSAEALRLALEFVYEGCCRVEESALVELLEAASFLRIAPLVDAAAAELEARLSAHNSFAAMSLAESHGLAPLMDAARQTALQRFEACVREEGLGGLSYEQLLSLLSDDGLTTREEAVHEAVVSWANAQTPPPSEERLLALFKLVRYPLIPRPFMEATVLNEPLLQPGPLMAHVLQHAFMTIAYGTPMQRRLGQGRIFVVGGQNGLLTSMSSVAILDPATRAWQEGPQMSTARSYAGVAMLNGRLYAVGGTDGPNILSSVEILDPATGAWQAGPPMSESRASAASLCMAA